MDNVEGLETITMSPGMHQMMIQGAPGTEPQMLQVLSIKDANALTKAMNGNGGGNIVHTVKHEEGTIIE